MSPLYVYKVARINDANMEDDVVDVEQNQNVLIVDLNVGKELNSSEKEQNDFDQIDSAIIVEPQYVASKNIHEQAGNVKIDICEDVSNIDIKDIEIIETEQKEEKASKESEIRNGNENNIVSNQHILSIDESIDKDMEHKEIPREQPFSTINVPIASNVSLDVCRELVQKRFKAAQQSCENKGGVAKGCNKLCHICHARRNKVCSFPCEKPGHSYCDIHLQNRLGYSCKDLDEGNISDFYCPICALICTCSKCKRQLEKSALELKAEYDENNTSEHDLRVSLLITPRLVCQNNVNTPKEKEMTCIDAPCVVDAFADDTSDQQMEDNLHPISPCVAAIKGLSMEHSANTIEDQVLKDQINSIIPRESLPVSITPLVQARKVEAKRVRFDVDDSIAINNEDLEIRDEQNHLSLKTNLKDCFSMSQGKDADEEVNKVICSTASSVEGKPIMDNICDNKKITHHDYGIRIILGSRFRVDFDEPDFGTVRKQWYFGTATSCSKQPDTSKSSNDYVYQIGMKYDDESTGMVEYPDPEDGVELLIPESGNSSILNALTANGTTFACDSNPKSIRIGDLVDFRMKRNGPLSRGRVADLNEGNKTCFVVFPCSNYEPRVPLKKGYIIRSERGAQETKWLIGMPITINKRHGKITRVKEFDNEGHASVFEIKIKLKASTRTYAQIMDILFSRYIIEEGKSPIANTKKANKPTDTSYVEGKLLKEEDFQLDFKTQPTCSVTSKQYTTPIHSSLSNALWRALKSDAHNGFEMISHLMQAKNITPNASLSSNLRGVMLQESKDGPKWNEILLSEFASRCNTQFPLYYTQRNMKWIAFERYLLSSTDEISSNSFSTLILAKITFVLELFNQVLQKQIEEKLSCGPFFGCDGAHSALKCLSYCSTRFWTKHATILLNIECPSNYQQLIVRTRRCVEAFGTACSRLAAVYCTEEGLCVGHEKSVFIMRDSLLEGLSDTTLDLSPRSLKELKLLFVLSLDDIIQTKLSKMLCVAPEFANATKL